jgi:SagB-type dehydrogenase family enzyme
MEQTIIKLPNPQLKGNVSLEETTVNCRSVRRYSREPLNLSQLSQILWSTQGITGTIGLKAAPSAGATYPLEIFIFISKGGVIASKSSQVPEELPAGIYHYEADSHSSRLRKANDLTPDLARAALDQEFIFDAPVNIVICALYHGTSYRYGKRGERYVHIEARHVVENIHLQAVAFGLAGVFHDEEVR